MSNNKPLLGPCNSYQLVPFAYEWSWELYQQCRKNEWSPKEIGVAEDVADWKSNDLPDVHRHLFLSIMAQLTTFDIERGDDAAESFLRILQPAEIKQFLKRLIFEEAGHTESYRYCIENMGIPEYGPDNVYDIWEKVPEFRERVEFAQSISDPLLEWSHKKIEAADYSLEDKEAFLRAAVFWFLIFEGVWFWMSLLGPVQQLARLGVFRKTAEQFILITRDEQQHILFGVRLIKEFMLQYPEAVNERSMAQIHEDLDKALLLEDKYIHYCLSQSSILGYSAADHSETARYVANMRLRSIGLSNRFSGVEHKFPWFSEALELNKERNFFETRVTDYQIGGLSFDDDEGDDWNPLAPKDGGDWYG